jgi:hypothetical protein
VASENTRAESRKEQEGQYWRMKMEKLFIHKNTSSVSMLSLVLRGFIFACRYSSAVEEEHNM